MKPHRNLITHILLIAIMLCPLAPGRNVLAQEITPTPDPVLLTTAQEYIAALAQGQFEQAAQYFDPTLLQGNTRAQLQEAWKSLIQQMGAFQEVSKTIPAREGDYPVVYVVANLANGQVDIKVVFNQARQVIGMFYTPAGTGKASSGSYRPATYADPDTFTEQEVTVGANGPYPLPATLTMPKGQGPFPAIVLVHGSGPNDRDETIFNNKPFRDLAEGLASRGIAVLRYDKRTKIYGEEMYQRPEQITIDAEVTDDAIAALQLLAQTPGIDPNRIYLLGHSLGGMLAPRIAEQVQERYSDVALAGLLILAGPTRLLEDIMIDQVTYLANLDGELTAEEETKIEQLKEQAARVKDPGLTADAPPDQTLGAPGAYWLSLREVQPAQTAAKLSLPLLILRGERDYQVTQADFDGWKAALGEKDGVTYQQYPALNHLFISGSGPANPQEYQRPGNVSQQVVEDIASFILTGDVKTPALLLGGRLSQQDLVRLVLLLVPILLIQLALSIYALVDLARRKRTHGPRWLWATLLVLTLFALPTGLIVAAIYLIWGRKEEDEDGDHDTD
jgi:hypothetical protein